MPARHIMACSPCFRKDVRGSVAILFGLSVMMLGLAVGLAVDSSRAYNISSRVQHALDAAALAGAKLIDQDGITEAEILAEAKRYFDSYVPDIQMAGLSLSNFRISAEMDANRVEALVDVGLPTLFGGLAGFSSFDFVRSSSATYRATKIELSLVVDVTGSMCDVPPVVGDPPCAGGAKLDALKTAANDMVDALFESDPRVGAVKVALIPYSASVNAGPYSGAVSNGASTDGCVVERSGPNAFTNAHPSAVNQLGVSDSATAWYYSCLTPDVVPLTDLSSNAARTAFKDSINNLAAYGGTAGHIGAAWGWYMLSPEWGPVWPANAARPYDPARVIKAVVLMTDGMFNVAYDNGGEVNPWPDPLAADSAEPGSSGNQALSICNAMRNPGDATHAIRIYTVAFQAPPEAEALLRTCSGDSNFYDAATASQLNNAFKDIVKKLNSLRVTS